MATPAGGCDGASAERQLMPGCFRWTPPPIVSAHRRAWALREKVRYGQSDGPDVERNGLDREAVLCVLHHKLLDLGAFTLEPGGCLLVSEQPHGSAGFDDSLMCHHGAQVRRP